MYLGKRVAVFVLKALVAFALVLMVAHLFACVSVGVTPLARGEAREAVAPEDVVVYRTADQVGRPYREIALLDAAGESMTTSDARMYAEMRRKAGALGANGIVLDASGETSGGARVSPLGIGLPAVRRGKAVAIVVEGEVVRGK